MAKFASIPSLGLRFTMPMEFLKNCNIYEKPKEVNYTSYNFSWMDSLLEHLVKGKLPLDKVEPYKVKYQAALYLMIHGVLYRKGYYLSYLTCLGNKEVEFMLKEIHKGICGNHSGGKSQASKLLDISGYFK